MNSYTFNFTDGLVLDQSSKRAIGARKRRTPRKRTYGAPCNCFELELQCHHKISERTNSLGDSVTLDAHDTRPRWQRHHALERMSNSQRIKTS